MQPAPVSMPATTTAAFTSARGDDTVRCSFNSPCRPALSQPHHRYPTRCQPAEPIGFGSSKTTERPRRRLHLSDALRPLRIRL